MIQQRIRGINSLLALTQALLAVVLYWGWYLYFGEIFLEGKPAFVTQYTIYSVICAAGILLENLTRSSNAQDLVLFETSLVRLAPIAMRQLGFSIGAVLIFVVLTKDLIISRLFLVTFIPLLLSLLLWTNHSLPKLLARHFFSGSHAGRTLLVGPQRRASGIRDWLEAKSRFGFQAIGLLTHELAPAGRFLPILGVPLEIEKVIREHQISQVILLELPFSDEGRHIVETTQRLGVRLVILSDLQEKLRHPVVHFEDSGIHFLALHEEPLENPLSRASKRTLDLIVSIPVVVLVLPPVALLVWIIQRVQSPGPLFFRQPRAGLQNREFQIIKFRTMHVGNPDEARQATRDDERVFPFAKWLRRFSIDELPQFLNVVRGEMSVVGPRPHLLQHNEAFAQVLSNYHIRAFVKPGITGLAQVRGFRGEAKTPADISARLQSDLIYLENWSLLLDLSIIGRTALQVILPPNTAY